MKEEKDKKGKREAEVIKEKKAKLIKEMRTN